MNPRIAHIGRLLALGLIVLNLVLVAAVAFVLGSDLRDFGSFYASGKAESAGDNPYGVYEDTFRVHVGDLEVDSPNLNPPISVYPFQFLALFNPYAAKAILNLCWALLYVGVFYALLRAGGRKPTPLLILWGCSFAGLWYVLELGQLYMPLLAVVSGACLLQDRRPLLTGVLIGLTVAFKPNFLVWPALLLLAGDRKTSLSSVATAAAISIVPLAIDGPRIYEQWIEATRVFTGLAFPNNASLFSVFARLGLDEAGIASSVAVALALGAWALVKRPSKAEIAPLALVGALLLGPVTWAGYTLVALPVLLSRRWGGWEQASAWLLAFPLWLLVLLATLHPALNVVAGSIYGWGLLILFGLVAADAYRQARFTGLHEQTDVEETAALAA